VLVDPLVEIGALCAPRVRIIVERQRRLLLSWAKAGKDSKGGSKATRSEALGDPSHLRRSYPQAAA